MTSLNDKGAPWLPLYLQPHWGDVCELGTKPLGHIITMAVPLEEGGEYVTEAAFRNVFYQIQDEMYTRHNRTKAHKIFLTL